MSVIDLPNTASAHAYAWTTNTVHRAQLRLERGLVRYDGWFLVFTAVILGMALAAMAAATIALGRDEGAYEEELEAGRRSEAAGRPAR